MICTVSTIKDSRENIERFVARNLAAGADHMFVFLDGVGLEGEDFLRAQEHVTVVVTDPGYWGGSKTLDNLNLRQVTNANLVNFLLAATGWADRLVHLDGDECLHVDKDRLLAVPADVPLVGLTPWEAVSQFEQHGEVEYFKRLLEPGELMLLEAIGLLEAPKNRTYFRGHVRGRPAVRPSAELILRIHDAWAPDQSPLPALEEPGLHMLHYESASAAEFIRKWQAHLSGGSGAKFKDRRARIGAALGTVAANPHLDEAGKRHFMEEIYRRNVAEDVDTLSTLGFVQRPDPRFHAYEPAGLDDAQRDQVATLLELLHEVDKRYFMPRRTAKPMTELRDRTRRRMRRSHPRLLRTLAWD